MARESDRAVALVKYAERGRKRRGTDIKGGRDGGNAAAGVRQAGAPGVGYRRLPSFPGPPSFPWSC